MCVCARARAHLYVCVWYICYVVKGHMYDLCGVRLNMCDVCMRCCIYVIWLMSVFLYGMCVMHMHMLCIYAQYKSMRYGVCAIMYAVFVCLCLVCGTYICVKHICVWCVSMCE